MADKAALGECLCAHRRAAHTVAPRAPSGGNAMNRLFFGDNLHILRSHIADQSVDLIYLDPPFNSKRDYNLLFKSPKAALRAGNHPGAGADANTEQVFGQAQITAFEDTWHWGQQAEDEFREVLRHPNTAVADLMLALRAFLKENDMMAYLTAMCVRLLEMHRVLKPTASLYLHCDPTASHYLKLVLDGVFGPERFCNEIIWKRTGSHSSAKRFGPVHDVLLYYRKSERFTWSDVRLGYESAYLEKYYRFDDGDGRLYWRNSLTAAGTRKGSSGLPWRGFDPGASGSHWKFTVEKLEELDAQGLIYWPPGHGYPQIKRYRDELKGLAIGDVWEDIDKINPAGSERLGYPTQKPLALLERIIAASTNEGDVVLDPFCGCGTAIHAAQNLRRGWIGIDITHLAVGLIERRMKKAFPELAEKGAFTVEGVPKDLAGARDLADRDKYQFQFWALALVGAQPFKGGKKGADGGIDGIIYAEVDKAKTEKILVSVKGGDNVTLTMLKDLVATVAHNKAAIGLFVTRTKPTRPMIVEAAAAGHYVSPLHGEFPRIQILTIEGLLAGTERPRYPDLSMGAQTTRAAKVEPKRGEQGTLL